MKEQAFGNNSLKLLAAGGSKDEDRDRSRRRGSRDEDRNRCRSIASVRHSQALLLLRIFLFIFFLAVFLVFDEKVVRKWRGWLRMDVCESEYECERARARERERESCWRCVALSYIGAAEMAQGRGRWRKWRRASVGDRSGAGPWFVTEVARGRRFSAFFSDAHGLLPASSPLSLFRFLPLQADRFPSCWFKLVQHVRRGP